MDKEENTIWRLTEEDFFSVGNQMDLSQEEIEDVISIARYAFNISSWAEYVTAFFENHKK